MHSEVSRSLSNYSPVIVIQAAYLSDDGVVCGRNFVVKSVDSVEFPLRFDGNSVVVLVVIFHGSSFVSA